MVTALVPVFFGLLLFGLPIFAALALAVTIALWVAGSIDPMIVPLLRMLSAPLPTVWIPYQVPWLIEFLMNLTLSSAKVTFTPPGWLLVGGALPASPT